MGFHKPLFLGGYLTGVGGRLTGRERSAAFISPREPWNHRN